ncbi:protein REPRESSOR OF SILENCING 3 isoform X1 [Coffea arabica]|uniref:Protein REPRESSOR OF SILENCING 3 isoform X1 n=2 Tax=Coffea arabica TaxID=13443 RepID=A0A6P6SMI0_COFAR|nr:uncharacterized protein LOC113692746 isoform X1 [Coffea arabica]
MGTEEEGGCGGGGAAAATAAASHRIYVGGLGGNVTAEDLKNTFSSPQLGSVESVEIVRTKGRSFAYLDFVPSSDKGLAKLFSMYNGCMWKGGRLRLEKAKEHYVLRLRREWEEDAKLSIDSNSFDGDAVVNMPSLEKPVKAHNLENTQLRIFFPKLRKVKPVPLKGTGKHKYSFPRVEVPPLPIHLCDCEEHSGSSDAANKSFHREEENDGINEEELNMMSSVMNKLFERENISETACTKVGFTTEAFVSRNSVDDIQVDQERDQISDEDNLIMNMVAGSNSGITTADAWEQNAISGNQEPSRSRSLQRIHKNQGKATVLSKKKWKAAQDFDTIPDQVAEPGTGVLQPSYHHMCPKKSIRRDLVSEGENSFRISDILQSNETGGEMQSKPDSSTLLNCKDPPSQSSQIKVVNESTETICGTPNAGIDKGREGNSFLNRSSWMQLVGSNSSFSISQILPGLNLEKQEIPQFNVTDSSTSTKRRQDFMKTDKSDFITDVSKSQPVVDIPKFSLADSKTNHASQNQLDSVKKLQGGKSSNDAYNLPFSEKQPIQAKRTSMGDRGMPETFTFKRSAASMKEWKKAKAAVSGSQKKRVKKK